MSEQKNPVAIIRTVQDGDARYEAILFWCPGCEVMDDRGRMHGGLHMLPVLGNPGKRPIWTLTGTMERPTLAPSIKTTMHHGDDSFVCHSFLRNGVFEFLDDCTHRLVGEKVPMPELPDWVLD